MLLLSSVVLTKHVDLASGMFEKTLLIYVNIKSSVQFTTLPQTNMAPENRVAQKEIHLPTIHFQVRAVSFREGKP